MTPLRITLTACFGALVVAALVGFTTAHAKSSTPSTAAGQTGALTASSGATDLQNTFVNVFRLVSPSVVQIQTSSGLGSGIVFDSKGDIVTNYHVVSGSTSFRVTTSTGKNLSARLVG